MFNFIKNIFKKKKKKEAILTLGNYGIILSHHLFLTSVERKKILKGKKISTEGYCVSVSIPFSRREEKTRVKYMVKFSAERSVSFKKAGNFNVGLCKQGAEDIQDGPHGGEFHTFTITDFVQVDERPVPLMNQVIIHDKSFLERSTFFQ
jgi:hypothetical protein